MPQADQIGS